MKNTGAGPDYYEDNGSSYRVALRWKPIEAFLLDYAFDYRDVKDTPSYHQRQFDTHTFPFNFPLFPERQDVTWRDVDLDIHDDFLQRMHSLTGTWSFSDRVTLKSITGYMKTGYSNLKDMAEGYNLPQVTKDVGDHKQFQQEFLLSGESVGGGLKYQAGLFYFEEWLDAWNTSLNSAFALGGRNPYVPPTLADLSPPQHVKTDFTSYAIYGQASWTPSVFDKRLTVDVGGRVSWDDRFQSGTLARGVPHPDGRDSYTSFDPSATVDYHWNEDVHAFARVATAYRAGGFNFLPTRVIPYGAESLISYELGLKSMLWHRRLRANLNLFRSDYDDIQVAEVIPPTSADPTTRTLTVNGGTGVIQGADMLFEVLLHDSFTVRAAATYLDATAEQTNPVTGVVSNTALAGVPEWSYTLSGEYRWVLNRGTYSMLVSYLHKDDMLSPSRLTDMQPSCGKMNASLSLSDLEVLGGNMKFTLWGDNITDADCEIYHAWDAVNYIRPQNFGVSVQFNFN